LKDSENVIIPQAELTYKWRIISFIGKDCDQQCEKRLFDTRQIHTSLGKDQHRLSRMFIHLQPAGADLTKLIAETHSKAIEVYGDAEIIIDVFGNMNNEVYIMDPMGNVMMRFTQDQPNKEFLHDLKKLLKASQIG